MLDKRKPTLHIKEGTQRTIQCFVACFQLGMNLILQWENLGVMSFNRQNDCVKLKTSPVLLALMKIRAYGSEA
jgi:hypothetical protein